MRCTSLVASLILTASAAAQNTQRGKLLGTWNVEYERMIVHMHAEPTRLAEHGRMTLRAVGDSIFGELRIGDSTSTDLSALRGVAHNNSYALLIEDPAAKGLGIFFSAVGAAMDWLRESVHGIQPTVVRLDLVAKGDSLTGSRTATGGNSPAARISTVTGRRTAK